MGLLNGNFRLDSLYGWDFQIIYSKQRSYLIKISSDVFEDKIAKHT